MDIINIQTCPNGKLTTTNPFQPQTSASTKDNKKNLNHLGPTKNRDLSGILKKKYPKKTYFLTNNKNKTKNPFCLKKQKQTLSIFQFSSHHQFEIEFILCNNSVNYCEKCISIWRASTSLTRTCPNQLNLPSIFWSLMALGWLRYLYLVYPPLL